MRAGRLPEEHPQEQLAREHLRETSGVEEPVPSVPQPQPTGQTQPQPTRVRPASQQRWGLDR